MLFFNILKIILIIVEVVVCVLLITAVLMQKSKTQGAGLAFGSGVGETLFGGQIGNVMTRITVVLAVIFLVNTTLLTFLTVKVKYSRAAPAAAAQVIPGQESAPDLQPPESMPLLPPMEDSPLAVPENFE